jgi:DUF1365 family protein
VRSALYTGQLTHARSEPRENVFSYRVSFFLLDLDELPELDRRLGLLAVNRRGVVSFRDADHFADPRRTTKENVLALLAGQKIDLAGGHVLMLAQLRVLGYVFNPVSFFYCYDADGQLAAIVSEVSNTFGERLPEVLSPANQVPSRNPSAVSFTHDKRLHVSPFLGLDQSYRYFFSEPGERLYARIDVFERNGSRPLVATLTGERRELTNASLTRTLLAYPLMPARVTALIHWQALRLFLKRVPFHHKPPFRPGEGSLRQ